MQHIASTIKPRNGTHRSVSVHGKLYTFTRTTDAAGEPHYVAPVDNEEHAETLLNSGAFYPFDADAKAAAPPPGTLTRRQPGNKGKAPTKATTEAAPVPGSAAVVAEAMALLAGDPAALATAVGKVSGLNVLRAAIVLENNTGTPRKPVLDLLQGALDGAIAAGVKG